jgi:hypothetical protein
VLWEGGMDCSGGCSLVNCVVCAPGLAKHASVAAAGTSWPRPQQGLTPHVPRAPPPPRQALAAEELAGAALALSHYQAQTDADEVDLGLIESLLQYICEVRCGTVACAARHATGCCSRVDWAASGSRLPSGAALQSASASLLLLCRRRRVPSRRRTAAMRRRRRGHRSWVLCLSSCRGGTRSCG